MILFPRSQEKSVTFWGGARNLKKHLAESTKYWESVGGFVIVQMTLNWFHKLAALRLAKECSEEIYTLTKDGPFVKSGKKIQIEFEKIKRESGIANQ
jgi:hypothetical protein